MHRLMVSAAHKSSGKTTLTLGLAAALAAQGTVVQAFKKGPDYIDPLWLSLAAGRPCLNLDMHLQTTAAVESLFAQGCVGAGLALVEGNMGLYDGLALDGSNSNAALARQLGLPVLLVLDARGTTRGLAPLLLGYQAFDRSLHIAGVILNRVGGSRHEAKLRAAIEHYTDVPVLGAVAEDPTLALAERHLGLMPCAEHDDAVAWVRGMAGRVAAQVDLPRVRALAASAGPVSAADQGARAGRLPAAQPAVACAGMDAGAGTVASTVASTGASTVASTGESASPSAGARLRIGITRDRAFGFYYPDDLAALQAAGAELLFIDTLRDQHLPALDGLFMGGGFPETCMAELQANTRMRQALRQAIEGGLPTVAECGGLMYLSRSITWQGRAAAMVGVIPGDAVMHGRPVGRGYVQLQATGAAPWGPAEGGTVHGHEFHHSSIENLPPGLSYAWRVQRGHGIDGRHDGLLMHRLLASYSHLRSAAGSEWATQFVAFVRQSCARGVAQPAQPAQAVQPAQTVPLVQRAPVAQAAPVAPGASAAQGAAAVAPAGPVLAPAWAA